MLELEGIAAILEGWAVQVSDGENIATAPINSAHLEEEESERVLYVEATFAGEHANFEWRERRIVTKEGVVLDREVEDMGRKAAGTIADVQLEIVVPAGA